MDISIMYDRLIQKPKILVANKTLEYAGPGDQKQK